MLNYFFKNIKKLNIYIVKYYNIIHIEYVIIIIISLVLLILDIFYGIDTIVVLNNIIIYLASVKFIDLHSYVLFKPVMFIIIFIVFLYLRASIPRYKLVDFQNLYWKYLLVYSLFIHIITVLLF